MGSIQVQDQRHPTCNMQLVPIQKMQLETSFLQYRSRDHLGNRTKKRFTSTKAQTKTEDPGLSLNSAPGPGAAGLQVGLLRAIKTD